MKKTFNSLSAVSELYLFLFVVLSGALLSYISLLAIESPSVLGLYISQSSKTETPPKIIFPTPQQPTAPLILPTTSAPQQPTAPPTLPTEIQYQPQTPIPTQPAGLGAPSALLQSSEISAGQQPKLQAPVYVEAKVGGELINVANPSIEVQYQPTISTVILKAVEYSGLTSVMLKSSITSSNTPTNTRTDSTSPISISPVSSQNLPEQQTSQAVPYYSQAVQSTDQIVIIPLTIIRQVELADSSVAEIENIMHPYRIAVKPAGGNTISISRNEVTVFTQLPIRLNVNRTSVFVLTPDGKTNAIYYADVIAEYAQDTNLLTDISKPEVGADAPLKLYFINNDLVYDIHGCSQQYLFAFFPLCINRTVRISAKTKTIYGISHSQINQILDILSI